MYMRGLSSVMVEAEYEGDVSDVFDDDVPFFTEIATRLIYEAQFFEDFVLVRPASPAFHAAMMKIDDYAEFTEKFEEFAGCHQELRAFLNASSDGGVLEVK